MVRLPSSISNYSPLTLALGVDTTPSCFDPIGPWNLESFIKLPDCSTRLNFSTIHDKANINVTHVLKIMLRVERGDDDFLDSKGKRKVRRALRVPPSVSTES